MRPKITVQDQRRVSMEPIRAMVLELSEIWRVKGKWSFDQVSRHLAGYHNFGEFPR